MHTENIKNLYKGIIFSYICKILREHSKKDKLLSENEIEAYLREDLAKDEKYIIDLVQKHTNVTNYENIIDSIKEIIIPNAHTIATIILANKSGSTVYPSLDLLGKKISINEESNHIIIYNKNEEISPLLYNLSNESLRNDLENLRFYITKKVSKNSGQRLNSYYIIKILEKYSFKQNHLSISDIDVYLNEEFDSDLKTSTIARTLNDIVQDNSSTLNLHRFDKNNKENTDESINLNTATCSYYIDSIFALDEIEMLLSVIESYTYMPLLNKQEFISKINSLISKEKHSKYIAYNSYNDKNSDDGKILKNIPNIFDIFCKLNEAINSKKKIMIIYGEYTFDYMKIELQENFSEELSPYFILFDHGQFNLFATSSSTNNLTSYRIDQIVNVTLLDDGIEEFPSNKDYLEFNTNFTLEKFRSAHPYMCCGEIKDIELLCENEPEILSSLMDTFGLKIRISKLSINDDNLMIVKFRSSTEGVALWATQYCRYCKVIEPTEVAEKVKNNLFTGLNKYTS